MTLRELEIGKGAVIEDVGGEGALRQHFLDMGVIPGAKLTVTKYAPMGDPIEIKIRWEDLWSAQDQSEEKLPQNEAKRLFAEYREYLEQRVIELSTEEMEEIIHEWELKHL